LTHEYKDKSGKITKHGKIAIYGIFISATISVISVGINIRKVKVQELKQKESFVAEINRYTKTLNEIKRLAYPLTDLIIEETYELSNTAKGITEFNKSLPTLIESIRQNRKKYGVAIHKPKWYL